MGRKACHNTLALFNRQPSKILRYDFSETSEQFGVGVFLTYGGGFGFRIRPEVYTMERSASYLSPISEAKPIRSPEAPIGDHELCFRDALDAMHSAPAKITILGENHGIARA